MINPCMVHWKAFVALGVLIGGVCAIWARVVYGGDYKERVSQEKDLMASNYSGESSSFIFLIS